MASEKADPTAGHSPIPWFCCEGQPREDSEARILAEVVEGWSIYAEVHGESTEADSRFIVRAVNHHDALVGALRDILAAFQDSVFQYDQQGGPALRNARAVLRDLDQSPA